VVPLAIVRQYAVGQQIAYEVADQEIVLHYALRLLTEAGLVGRPEPGATPGALLFKGGTALRKCVFGSAGRFSQDVDLDATHENGFEAEIERERAVEFELRPAAGAQRARLGQEMPDVDRHERRLARRCRRDRERDETQQDAHGHANCGGMPPAQQRESKAARL